MPAGLESASGAPIRFVPAGELPGVDYESHIYHSGEISTREASWHDLFNALAWCRFPRLKAAMNRCHQREMQQDASHRNRMRDALTLLDESGALVVSSSEQLLNAIAERKWQQAFRDLREDWNAARIAICGHALLEKFLQPYKAMTAHIVLVHASTDPADDELDSLLSSRLLNGGLMKTPRDLGPLPLMGIPGWWPAGAQDEEFYSDTDVFRIPSRPFTRPSLHPAS